MKRKRIRRDIGIEVIGADPRVELMSLIFRLAGNPEYSQCRLRSYDKAIKEHFTGFEDHLAVKLATKLREQRGVGFDAPMGLAIRLSKPPFLRMRVPISYKRRKFDRRLTPRKTEAFVDAARRFIKDSDFMRFYDSQRDYYNESTRPLRALIEDNFHLEWFDEFFGSRPKASFKIVIGFLNGGGSYGPRVKTNAGEELYSILGAYKSNRNGIPRFDERVVYTAVHEFCHSYVNSIIDNNLKYFRSYGERIFPLVRNAMRRQAYGGWPTMLIESLVRSCVVRYIDDIHGTKAAAELVAIEKERNRFLVVEDLSKILAEYECNREAFPTLNHFVPEMLAMLEELVEGEGREPIFDLPVGYEPTVHSQLSPDGKFLTFSGLDWNEEDKPKSGLWCHNRKTGKVRKLLGGDIHSHFAWSSNSRHIAISTGRGYTHKHPLTLLDVATRKKTELGVNGAGPAFSPDGRKLAYSGRFKEGRFFYFGIPASGSICVGRLDKAAPSRRISPPGEGALQPVWSPDGRQIAYQVLVFGRVRRNSRPKRAKVYITSLRGKYKEVYSYRTPQSDRLYPISWSADGGALIITTLTETLKVATDGSGVVSRRRR